VVIDQIADLASTHRFALNHIGTRFVLFGHLKHQSPMSCQRFGRGLSLGASSEIHKLAPSRTAVRLGRKK
jgi:hypothetical protein